MKRLLIVIVVLGVLGAAAYLSRDVWKRRDPTPLRTDTVVRTDILSTIQATGTVEPEEVVDVGAQVAGLIVSFGTDEAGKTIDYGSQIKAGTVLANIDPSLYAADVAQGEAQLNSAKAGVQLAKANLLQYHAKLDQAAADWDRAQKLGPSELLSQADFDAMKASYEAAQANISVGEAAVAQAESGVNLAEATLSRAKRNLDYCTIKCPVDGVIIDRRVNIGQTVVSSLNAPSLFLIAKDLRRMQVWVAVNEADVGHIHQGQRATFTVDAFPGRTFEAIVGKIRLNAAMTQNVVTYTVELETDNSDSTLLPYLTANVDFEVARRDNVLAVPNAALRWTPDADRVDPAFAGEASNAPAGARKPGSKATLWVPAGDLVRPVAVTVGLTNGSLTEVSGDGVTEGMTIVTGEQRAGTGRAAQGATNPFTPQLGRARQSANPQRAPAN